MAGLITDGDVSRLNNHALRAVLNALLTAEADFRKVPITNLDLNLRDTDPDGGVDAKIIWPDGAAHDVLRSGTVICQFKAGVLKSGEIASEFKKPRVQEIISASASQYILFVARDYVEKSRARHRKSLVGLCKRRKIDPKRCSIVYGDQIARWISRFPAVMIRPELAKGYPAFITVEQWQQERNLRNPFKLTPEREEVIKELRLFAADNSEDNTFRIEGQAGVGKTRLALEALRSRGMSDRTLYCRDAENPNTQQLLTALLLQPQASAIVVVDECEREEQEKLRSFAGMTGGRLRLVCVGPADKIFSAPVAARFFFQLKQLPDEEMRLILADAYPAAPREIVDFTVRVSGGMPKLAMFIASTLVSYQGLRLSDLLDVPDISTFLVRFVDTETVETLKGLSLLAKVGWDGNLRAEAETIATKALNLSFDDMRKAVVSLRERGVVLSRGKYLYVSPDLLAISAAARLWDEKEFGLINIISELPGQGPRRQLLQRIAIMTDFPVIRRAIQKLLGPEGLFKTIDYVDQDFPSEIFRYLAAALPEEAQQTLDRIFQNATEERLLDFKTGRRDVMWALESLLRWPDTSIPAARIVGRLALAENENVSNNATGTFQQYFHAFLSGSPIPLKDRLQLVTELLVNSSAPRRMLAVKALAGALAFHEMRMGGDIDAVSQRRYPAEWKPKTWDELWDARKTAIAQLSSISTGTDEAAREAREVLYHSVFTLTRHGQVKDALYLLRDHPPQNDKDSRSVLEATQRIHNDALAALDDADRQLLDQIVNRTFGPTYFDRLRRWVGRRTHGDFDLTGGTGFSKADLEVIGLADEGFKNGISDAEITWLASPEAENVWVFGKQLGALDASKAYLGRIMKATPTDLNCMLLGSYLVGLGETSGKEIPEKLLDELAESNPELAFAATWRFGPTVRGGQRTIDLMQSKRIPDHYYRALQYGGWLEAIPMEIAHRIMELMLDGDPNVTAEPLLSILGYMTRTKSGTLAAVEDLAWKAIDLAAPVLSPHADWELGDLASRLAPSGPIKVADLVIRRLKKDDSPHISGDPLVQALSTATRIDPVGVWKLVGKELISKDIFGFRLLLSLDKWYGELIPTDALIQWAKEHQPRGPLIAAQLIGTSAPLSERSRALIAAFPENEDILHVFASSLLTGHFMGTISGNLERALTTVRQWEQDPDIRIKTWARRLASDLEKQIKEQKLIEEGEDF